jgi:hypothetical protein
MFLKQEMARLYPDSKHLVIMSDLDELPSSTTIRLLKGCDFGMKIHLQLKNYLYRYASTTALFTLTNSLGYHAALNGSLATTAGDLPCTSGDPIQSTVIRSRPMSSSLMPAGTAATVSERSKNTP